MNRRTKLTFGPTIKEHCLLFPSCAHVEHHGQVSNVMASTLITRNQFNITSQGIVHKPTDAAFVPHLDDPCSGTMRLGELSNQPPNGFDSKDVQRIMRELWAEYVSKNPKLFKP